MALDVQYTTILARQLAPYNLKWIEEPLMPDEYAADAKLAKNLEGLGFRHISKPASMQTDFNS